MYNDSTLAAVDPDRMGSKPRPAECHWFFLVYFWIKIIREVFYSRVYNIFITNFEPQVVTSSNLSLLLKLLFYSPILAFSLLIFIKNRIVGKLFCENCLF